MISASRQTLAAGAVLYITRAIPACQFSTAHTFGQKGAPRSELSIYAIARLLVKCMAAFLEKQSRVRDRAGILGEGDPRGGDGNATAKQP